MLVRDNQETIKELNVLWRAIRLWFKERPERMITPRQLAYETGYSEENIRKGLNGEAISITDEFARDFVRLFGLVSGRMRSIEETEDVLSGEECRALIKSILNRRPTQGALF
ncbi:MAG: hypothetical protein ABH834_02670 [Candidatus Altiarchaeota archaeon]